MNNLDIFKYSGYLVQVQLNAYVDANALDFLTPAKKMNDHKESCKLQTMMKVPTGVLQQSKLGEFISQ